MCVVVVGVCTASCSLNDLWRGGFSPPSFSPDLVCTVCLTLVSVGWSVLARKARKRHSPWIVALGPLCRVQDGFNLLALSYFSPLEM